MEIIEYYFVFLWAICTTNLIWKTTYTYYQKKI